MSKDPSGRRGHLKIYLGYAAGVGKTYQMLEEGQALARHGEDVVIGYFEPHGRKDTIARTEGLETIPRKKVEYRGTVFDEMDTGAILQRKPKLCLVDELPHTNVPGSERAKRWEDVRALLDAGIDVHTTVNIQHLESLNDQVAQFSGVRVRETIPDWFVREADEVVMVDLTPGALLNRLARGVVYSPEKARQAVENFFKEPTLVALRELALRQTAHEVDLRHEMDGKPMTREADPSPSVPAEKVLIVVNENPNTAAVIRRGQRVADYLRAECFAVFVCPGAALEKLLPEVREVVEQHLNFARNLHIETRVLAGEDAADAIVEFARRNGVTQILVSRPEKTSLPLPLARRNLVFRLLELGKEFQVTVVADRRLSKGD